MEASARSWLFLVCQTIPGTTRGVVMLRATEGEEPKLSATWPAEAPAPAELVASARAALDHGRSILNGRARAAAEGSAPAGHVAIPLGEGAESAGAVAIEVAAATPAELDAAATQLRSQLAWLRALGSGEASGERLGSVLRLVSHCLEHETLRAASTALCTELATRLGCERVSLGLLRAGRMRVQAISHSAHFDERTQLVRDLAAAMDEAADQDTTLVHPPPPEAPPRIVRAHESLAQEHGVWDSCTLPLPSAGRIVGALTLERPAGQRFGAADVLTCEQIAALVGPIVALQRRAEAGLFEELREKLRTQRARLAGPGHLRLKLGLAGSLLGLLLLSFAEADHRVAADATLEGRGKRAIVARVDGYIAEANARAGDEVRQGQVLGQLDDRDLRVERQKWAARREQLRKEYFEAMATHDRSRISITNAKVAQAQAQLALLEEQLGRTRFLAPFDGVVVKGDLSQSLGSPVTRGELLFEIAPLDGYRVILEVDERDIADVFEGSRGRLTLSAMPGQPLPFTVERVTPVATAEDGGNYFRVEAQLDHPPDSLRPGLEGVAKIDAGTRRIGWIWTHDIVDWVRLRLWTWWP
ncbi:MAG: efflux RND transporter periplasmic adaptor subunit [Myxococcota bacterium]|nr:efflux RND transporter periplasmic adaptor subunit [Myxococcota bacterium]